MKLTDSVSCVWSYCTSNCTICNSKEKGNGEEKWLISFSSINMVDHTEIQREFEELSMEHHLCQMDKSVPLL